jgi:hypothetical protein
LRTYEANLLNAEKELLQLKNHTQVPSMDVLKTAIKEQANSMRLDSDMLNELTTMLFSLQASDKTSKPLNKGKTIFVAFYDMYT